MLLQLSPLFPHFACLHSVPSSGNAHTIVCVHEKWLSLKSRKKVNKVQRAWRTCESSSSSKPTYALWSFRRRRGAKRVFEDIMAEILPNLMKDMYLQVWEFQWTPNRINSATHVEPHYNVTIQKEERNLKATSEKQIATYKGSSIKLPQFSYQKPLKCWKNEKLSTKNSWFDKTVFQSEVEIKTYVDKSEGVCYY